MTHYTKEVEGMMNKFLDAEIKWVDIDNGLGKYMLASQVIEQAHKVFTEYQESLHHQLQKARRKAKLDGYKFAIQHFRERLEIDQTFADAVTSMEKLTDQAELEGGLEIKK